MSHEMQSPKKIVGEGIASAAGLVVLPPGEWFQVVHFSPGSIQYNYGNGVVSGALYPAVTGIGPLMLHPGTEVRIQLLQALGSVAFIHVRGGIPETGRYGWQL